MGKTWVMNDIWTWSAIALFVGPMVAAMMIPVFKWLFDDARRFLLVAALAGLFYALYLKRQASTPGPSPTPTRKSKSPH